MHIEWNRVTWYSWLAAVIVFGGALALGFYLGAKWEQVHLKNALTEVPAHAVQGGVMVKEHKGNKKRKGTDIRSSIGPHGNVGLCITAMRQGVSVVAARRLKGDRIVTVAGVLQYEATRWEEAIGVFIDSLKIMRPEVESMPKIAFGGLTLQRDQNRNDYYAYGTGPDPKAPVTGLSIQSLVIAGRELSTVETAMKVFLIDLNKQMLILVLAGGAKVCLWRRGADSYGCAGENLPRTNPRLH